MRADYLARLVGNVIVVIDAGTGTTVTNDAEAVVAALARLWPLEGRRIIYRDTDGRWDEIRHDGARFVGFHPLGAQTEEEAIELVRSPVRSV